MSGTTFSPRLTITTGTLCALVITVAVYARKLQKQHKELSSKIQHESAHGTADILAACAKDLNSIPQDLRDSGSKHVVLYDSSVKTVPRFDLPAWNESQMLTMYLRHNMVRFSRLPQAWLMWLMAGKATKKTFEIAHISRLDFIEGDRVCGTYTVLSRRPGIVELGMSLGQPSEKSYVEGRLVVEIHVSEEKEDAVITTQTFMWRRQDSGSVMPLERSLPRWAHQLASWGLIEQGSEYLQRLKEEEQVGND